MMYKELVSWLACVILCVGTTHTHHRRTLTVEYGDQPYCILSMNVLYNVATQHAYTMDHVSQIIWLSSPSPLSSSLAPPHMPSALFMYEGTSVYYQPGVLLGGTLEHTCSTQRSIGYFLEPLMMLAPFAKHPVRITLRGSTSGPDDPSVSDVQCACLCFHTRVISRYAMNCQLHKYIHNCYTNLTLNPTSIVPTTP